MKIKIIIKKLQDFKYFYICFIGLILYKVFNLLPGTILISFYFWSTFVLCFLFQIKKELKLKSINKNLIFLNFYILISYYYFSSVGVFRNEIRYIFRPITEISQYSSFVYPAIEDPNFLFTLIFKNILDLVFVDIYLLRTLFILLSSYSILRLYKISQINFFLFISFLYWFFQKQAFFGGNFFWGEVHPRDLFYSVFLLFIVACKEHKINKSLRFLTLLMLIHFGEFLILLPIIFLILFTNFSKNFYISITKYEFLFILFSLIFTLFNYSSYYLASEHKKILEIYVNEIFPHHLNPYSSDVFFGIVDTYGWSADVEQFMIYFILILVISLIFKKRFQNEFQNYSIITGYVVVLYFIYLYINPVGSFALLGPYRIVALFTFFTKLYLISILNQLFEKINLNNIKIFNILRLDRNRFLILVLSTTFLLNSFYFKKNNRYIENIFKNEILLEIAENINSLQPEIFIYETSLDKELYTLVAYTEYPNYFSYFLVPHNLNYYEIWNQKKIIVENLQNLNDCRFLKNFVEVVIISKNNLSYCDATFIRSFEQFNLWLYINN